MQCDGFIQRRVRPMCIGPNLHQIAAAFEFRVNRAKTPRQLKVISRHHVVHDARCRLLHIDGRVVAGLGQRARQHDMAIQYRPRRIGNWVLLVVTLRQHRIKGGDGTNTVETIAATLHQLRQLGKARWRVTFGGGRLADGQRDFTLRHGIAGQRVHQQQHMLAVVSEALGNGRGIGRTLQAQQWRSVSRCRHNHRSGTPLRAQNIFNKFLDLTATLTNQAHHNDISFGVARHHAQQHALAHTRPGKQANTLAAANRQQRVDGAYASVQSLAHRCTVHCIDGFAVQWLGYDVGDGSHAIHGQSLGIHYATQQSVAQGQTQHASVCRHTGRRRFTQPRHRNICRRRSHAGSAGQPMDIAGGHQKCALPSKTYDLGKNRWARLHGHHTLRPNGHADASGLQHQTRQPGQGAANFQRTVVRDSVACARQIVGPDAGDFIRHFSRRHGAPPRSIPGPAWPQTGSSVSRWCRRPRCLRPPPGSRHG